MPFLADAKAQKNRFRGLFMVPRASASSYLRAQQTKLSLVLLVLQTIGSLSKARKVFTVLFTPLVTTTATKVSPRVNIGVGSSLGGGGRDYIVKY
jgi:hypothetical protein